MDLRKVVPPAVGGMSTATTVVTAVLIASVIVASVLAWQAVTAARQRRAVSEAMLREYAQLAAWEFSREARKEIETTLTLALTSQVHQGTHSKEGQCDCVGVIAVDSWFEVSPEGVVAGRSAALPPETKEQVERFSAIDGEGSMEGNLRIGRFAERDGRVVAMRWEPHLGLRGGQVGLVTSASALEPLLARTHGRAALLPPLLVAGRDGRTLVDLRVHDRDGAVVFASRDTVPGPQVMEAELLPNTTVGFRLSVSMTPAFVAGLGPEHGAGSSQALVLGLVIVNGLLVAVGLWQLARERELTRLRADFVAGVSHELRTPLAQVRMFAETLLLDRIRSPHEGRRALEIIGQETRRLSQLVENILYFHRRQRAPLASPTAVVDLAVLIPEVVDGFSPLARSRRVRVEYASNVTELVVHANADGLRQVMLNLLDNAVKFGPPDEVVSVTLHATGDGARIAVEDRGPGVPVADQRRIFNAFDRGRASHGAGGAGIGLAVVRQIVGAHQGRVVVESALEGGARFVITLPIANGLGGDVQTVSLAG